jgi:LmbE family N-acetylglucosaminyl deacetylase
MKKVLAVVAHPDDEVLGCGGTINRFALEGNEISVLILGEGITSRDKKRDTGRCSKKLSRLKKDAKEACNVLGVKSVFFYDLPDNRFDTVPFLDIVKIVEEIKNNIKPSIIFTHFGKDLNIDHRITYNAVITATRPTEKEYVKIIYSFEIPSSTEWMYPNSFSPNIFFDISKSINIKLDALRKYKSEIVESRIHPRSLNGIKLNAQYWGCKIGVEYAEAFQIVRAICEI